jgi:hypothetical protein
MVNLKKGNREKMDNYFSRVLKENYRFKNSYQGVSIQDIELVLSRINLYTNDRRDAIWCLLNNEYPSLFVNSAGFTLADGASIAHIGGYIGILMRGSGRLDREGRDYWIKPLTEIGAIQKCTYISENRKFVPGHIKAKSPNSAYKLDRSFINLLSNTTNENFENLLYDWISKSNQEKRLKVEVEASKYEIGEKIYGESLTSKNNLDITVYERLSLNLDFSKLSESNSHAKLIKDSILLYAKNFLPTYEPIFIDAFDGDRVPGEDQSRLKENNISIELDDAWPDIILINKENESLWFIEAVTSDGEVDEQKMDGLKRLCNKSDKQFGGATTTYETWSKLAQRQKKSKNLAKNSYVWIREDPGRYIKIIN